MRSLLVLVVAACYSPTVHPGAPCGPGGACPGNLVCTSSMTCEAPGWSEVDAPVGAPIDSPPALDACTTCIAPANDLPGDAIDVTAGGDFTADLTYAHDDASSSGTTVCGAAGGVDVFYKVHLAASEVFYFDTFGSDFDTVIRVFRGPCTGGAQPNGTTCHNNAQCGASTATQWVGSLGAGDSCIVVDGNDGAQTGHSLKLHVERGGRDGIAVNATRTPSGAYTLSGNTTSAANVQDGSCAMHGYGEVGYYFIECPGQSLAVTASTCNATTAATPWDTALYADGPGGELACQDDDSGACTLGGGLSTINFTTSGAHLYWVFVDSGGGTPPTGAYELDLTFP
jgi:hypothetical protein